MSYAVKNTEVYESGQQKIRWVANKMPILNKIAEIYRDQKPFSGYRIAMSIHLEAKTAYLALKLKELGATVYLTGCNPLSTQDDVAAALVKEGINVFAWYDCTEEEYVNNLIKVLECRASPHHRRRRRFGASFAHRMSGICGKPHRRLRRNHNRCYAPTRLGKRKETEIPHDCRE